MEDLVTKRIHVHLVTEQAKVQQILFNTAFIFTFLKVHREELTKHTTLSNFPATDLEILRNRTSYRFPGLSVFDAYLYVQICLFDEHAECGRIYSYSRFQLHVTHELAGALE